MSQASKQHVTHSKVKIHDYFRTLTNFTLSSVVVVE